MARKPGLQVATEWCTDDMETDTIAADDDFDLDESIEEDTELDPQTDVNGNVPIWRLIEMSREARYLERELADFADYDVSDGNFASDNSITEYAY